MSQPHFSHAAPHAPRSKVVTLLLAIFLGPLGIHRFYRDQEGHPLV